jgi:ADP-heptose:LPS heptosyltransferase
MTGDNPNDQRGDPIVETSVGLRYSKGVAPRRVLIVLLGAIGDVVRALPLLGRIRRAWPAAHIAWAVEPKSQPVLDGHPWLNEIIVYDRRRAPWSFVPFLVRLRAGRFDIAFDLQRHLKSGIASLVSGAPMRLGFDRSNGKELNHLFSTHRIAPQPPMRLKLMQYQAFGDALALPQVDVEFGLAPTAADRTRAARLLEGSSTPRLAVILGSSWPSRFYFGDSIAAVIREFCESREGCPALFPVLIGSGREEAALAEEVLANLIGVRVLNLRMRRRFRSRLGSDAYRGCGRMSGGLAVGRDRGRALGTLGIRRPGFERRYPVSSMLPARMSDRARMHATDRAR